MSNIQVGITDHLDPEVQAMLLAMYSRTYAPIADRLPDSEESNQQHKEKLGKFYVGYNHKSVGQLGGTTVWLEGVSQLAAKAIENHPLFNGQESSTRYIDYGYQPMIAHELKIPQWEEIWNWQERFRSFYIKAMPLVIEEIKKEFPFEEQYKPLLMPLDPGYDKAMATWNNTVKARAFDICRGILPAGCTTNVGFVGTFDTLNDHFGEMLHHPSQEMRDIARVVLREMKIKYPYGTMDVEKLYERYAYVKKLPKNFYQPPSMMDSDALFDVAQKHSFIDEQTLEFLATREKFQKVDRVTSSRIRMTYRNLLDFGSYRDLHRHRPGVIDMCVLTPEYGYHRFYFDSLPEVLKEEFSTLLHELKAWHDEQKDISDVDKQYAIPMGFTIPVSYNCDLNQAMYIMELRTGKTVHQTLRAFVQDWVQWFKASVGDQVQIHPDMDEDNFSLKRGTQTFIEAPPAPESLVKLIEVPMSDENVVRFKYLMDKTSLGFGTSTDGCLKITVYYSEYVDELVSLLVSEGLDAVLVDNIDSFNENTHSGKKIKTVSISEKDINKFLYIYKLVSDKEKNETQVVEKQGS